jgi:hypothetical protein
MMAVWKRLTGVNGEQIDINVDQVCYMVQHVNGTVIHFSSDVMHRVKDKADDIHVTNPLPARH